MLARTAYVPPPPGLFECGQDGLPECRSNEPVLGPSEAIDSDLSTSAYSSEGHEGDACTRRHHCSGQPCPDGELCSWGSGAPCVKVSLSDSLFGAASPPADCEPARSDTATSEELELVKAVRDSISTTCQWLKVSHSDYHSTPEGGNGGSSGSLVVFLRGLPWARRAKWLVPLRLAVSNMLESCGFDLYLKLGHLYIRGQSESLLLRVDFAPALSSNVYSSSPEAPA